jgi:hypothetical protein
LIPFAVAVYTGKAQLVFVPYVPLTAMIVSEGLKYGCSVVKFTDVGCGKDVSLQTAAISRLIGMWFQNIPSKNMN